MKKSKTIFFLGGMRGAEDGCRAKHSLFDSDYFNLSALCQLISEKRAKPPTYVPFIILIFFAPA